MSKIKISQVRSVIDQPKKQKETIKALGLKRIRHTVEKEDTPQVRGMLKKVQHLVHVH